MKTNRFLNTLAPVHSILWTFALLGLVTPSYGVEQSQRAQEEYVGDDQCKTCHAKIYLTYRKTGHPYKLQKIEGGPPSYPNGTSSGVPSPPAEMSWDDISYVIGGFAWILLKKWVETSRILDTNLI